MADPEFMYIIAPYEGSDVVVSACHSKRRLREDLRDLREDWPGCVVSVCRKTGVDADGVPSYEHERWATEGEFLSVKRRRRRPRARGSEVQRG